MSMHMIRGIQVHGKTKKKSKKIDIKAMEVEWRSYNKDMRRKNMHSLQYDNLEDYISYKQGKPPKPKKEFREYEKPKSYVRNPEAHRNLQTSDVIPDSGSKRESQHYTGDLIIGVGQMHKSNAVPIMRGTNEAKDIAQMRRN